MLDDDVPRNERGYGRGPAIGATSARTSSSATRPMSKRAPAVVARTPSITIVAAANAACPSGCAVTVSARAVKLSQASSNPGMRRNAVEPGGGVAAMACDSRKFAVCALRQLVETC